MSFYNRNLCSHFIAFKMADSVVNYSQVIPQILENSYHRSKKKVVVWAFEVKILPRSTCPTYKALGLWYN